MKGEAKGMLDYWTDIPTINNMSRERTGYPTQKPLALLERIIQASSHTGDMVLDPFCGCATTCVAAYRHDREWAGIDLSETRGGPWSKTAWKKNKSQCSTGSSTVRIFLSAPTRVKFQIIAAIRICSMENRGAIATAAACIS